MTLLARGLAHPVARRTRRSLRQALLARRRLVTAALVAAAVAAGLRVLAPQPAPTVAVPVAVSDLPAGHRLTSADVEFARWPADLVPPRLFHYPVGSGSPRDDAPAALPVSSRPIGETLATPVRAGEPITDVRLRGPGLLLGQPPGTGSMAVRLTEPLAGLVHPGDRVDLIGGGDGASTSVPDSRGQAFVVARSVLVLAVGGAQPEATADGGTGLLDAPGVSDAGRAGEPEVLIVAVNTADALRIRAAGGGSLGMMVSPLS